MENVRHRICSCNYAIGIANSDHSGYHETQTRLFMHGVSAHIENHSGLSPTDSLALLLESPAKRDWPLRFYSPERLSSVEARHGWMEPDLMPLD